MFNKFKLLGVMAEKNFTQKKLAELLNLTEDTVSKRMNGISSFNTKEAEIICEALDIQDMETRANIFLA